MSRQHNQSLHDRGILQDNQPNNSLPNYSSHSQETFTFFYNPPGDFQTYHITCNEVQVSFELVFQLINDIDDNQTRNYFQTNYVFYHGQFNAKKIYRVTCELASPQFLNKKFYNIGYNKDDQQQQEFSPGYQNNLKFHLRQFLINNLAPKEIYIQTGNMMQDQTMNDQPSFQNDSDIQGDGNSSETSQSQQQ
ncbi:hypothetical protein C1645_843819 [Glomus cerebriforme]|uniref:Uncharacterized protein n=1 Tax=Glomus cerebriforme TaxID=658196 RepID=A0A397SB48_9GLOM|nr:hypothetical protein C1645_843819 [Glomus cerebriforme]